MAEGLQYKENLTLISGGYPGEGTGSNGLVQNWTDTTGDSGSSTVTYFYHDSATMTDANSTYVEINITDNWTATRDNRNYYHITVSTTINYIRRTKVGSPSPLSVYMFARHDAGGANIWTSGGCVDAANSGTNATNINMGTTTIDLAPGQSTNVHGTVYFRSNICGHNNAKPPSIYVDEFWLGVNFRNTLPPDYRPGKTWNGSVWLSHNRNSSNRTSENLFNLVTPASNNGVDIISNPDGSFTLNGKTTGVAVFNFQLPTQQPAGTYTISCRAVNQVMKSGHFFIRARKADMTLLVPNGDHKSQLEGQNNYYGTATFTCTDPMAYVALNLTTSGVEYDNMIIYPQVEKGSVATEFEPYGTYYISEGASDIYTSSSAKRTMRTKDGGVGTDDAPFIKHTDAWKNQREIGIE